ncbi:hypothetical protein E2C01_096847 [Portunus trituberculatus]|uniref:Uncharacterized protein n=1 Tax=Portunus trituberculatus TaxID=210409 RepID=A0A5B7K462_PORTR|nr:hypothetical protein [Portunus trituberculatus]
MVSKGFIEVGGSCTSFKVFCVFTVLEAD